MEPRGDFLDRDAKSLGWDGTNLTSIENKICIYRNGDFRAHVIAFERLDKVLIDLLSPGNCRQPYVKGLTLMSNSIYNGWRTEDVWLDR